MSKLKEFVDTIDEKTAAGKRTIVVPKDLAVAARDCIAGVVGARSLGGQRAKGKSGRPIENDTPAAKLNRERQKRHRYKSK